MRQLTWWYVRRGYSPATGSARLRARQRPATGGPSPPATTFTGQMHTDFPRALYEIGEDRDNRVLVLTGTGDRFMTEIDGQSLDDPTKPAVWDKTTAEGRRIMQRLVDLEMPIVAAVNGPQPGPLPTTMTQGSSAPSFLAPDTACRSRYRDAYSALTRNTVYPGAPSAAIRGPRSVSSQIATSISASRSASPSCCPISSCSRAIPRRPRAAAASPAAGLRHHQLHVVMVLSPNHPP